MRLSRETNGTNDEHIARNR